MLVPGRMNYSFYDELLSIELMPENSIKTFIGKLVRPAQDFEELNRTRLLEEAFAPVSELDDTLLFAFNYSVINHTKRFIKLKLYFPDPTIISTS